MNAQIIDTHSDQSDRAARAALSAAWKAHANQRKATAAQHAIFTLLSGRSLDRAFTPITNPVKLANGMQPSQGRAAAIASALSGDASQWEPFADLLEGAKVQERWLRRYYDMASHPLFVAFEAAAR